MKLFTVKPNEESDAKLELYLLEQSCEWKTYEARPFVLICPGGGYAMCGDRDSEPVALAYNGKRYHAGVLRYTIRPTDKDVPVGDKAILDVLSSIRYIRSHAAEYGIDPDKIILEGDSAGAHAAAMAAVYWNNLAFDPKAGEQSRPNAMILGYPVISAGQFGHRWSIGNLVGTMDYDEQAEYRYSAELHVGEQVCPAFIWHSVGDTIVPVENSCIFAQALHKAKIPYELHLFSTGWHGLGLGTGEVGGIEPHAANWFPLSLEWLSTLGLNPKD